MTRNIGTIDQVIRSILGIAFIAYAVKDGVVMSTWGLPVLAGACLLVTAMLEYCPLYSALGFTTVER